MIIMLVKMIMMMVMMMKITHMEVVEKFLRDEGGRGEEPSGRNGRHTCRKL